MYAAGTAIAAASVAGTFTIAGALAAAGGFFSAVGMLDKNKNAAKLGGILSLFSGMAGAFEGASAGATGAAEAGAATGTSDVAASMTQGAEGSQNLLTNPGLAETAPSLGSAGMDLGANLAGVDGAGSIVSPMGGGMGAAAGAAADTTSIAQGLTGAADNGSSLVTALGNSAPTQNLLERAAATMTQADVYGMTSSAQQAAGANSPGLFDQAMSKAGGYFDAAGKWIKANPTVANMGFKVLEGMYGPQAEAMDYQKGLMERARRNINTPVRLTYSPTGG
ncbi:MAG: hypothetical protein Q8N17_26070 [Burkholderiaceae bacterium]|nr:hypothetical protein [Burkholderiaceae bacterium]